jgi:hypothetical protein
MPKKSLSITSCSRVLFGLLATLASLLAKFAIEYQVCDGLAIIMDVIIIILSAVAERGKVPGA